MRSGQPFVGYVLYFILNLYFTIVIQQEIEIIS